MSCVLEIMIANYINLFAGSYYLQLLGLRKIVSARVLLLSSRTELLQSPPSICARKSRIAPITIRWFRQRFLEADVTIAGYNYISYFTKLYSLLALRQGQTGSCQLVKSSRGPAREYQEKLQKGFTGYYWSSCSSNSLSAESGEATPGWWKLLYFRLSSNLVKLLNS